MPSKKEEEALLVLETLRTTMSETEQVNVIMNGWLYGYEESEEPASETEVSPCGFAACICGEQALKQNFDVFPLSNTSLASLSRYAASISEVIDDKLEHVHEYLSSSIYLGGSDLRKEYASDTNLFTVRELEELEHLNSDNPSKDGVIKFLDVVIEKVKNHKG